MRILFLCGALESGADGVGDYTRRLAGNVILNGQQASIISINDEFISDVYNGEQQSEGQSIKVLRIPSSYPIEKRLELAKNWISEFDPEWLSLQFVPFSFHPKGMPFRLGRQLQKLGKQRKWHIMFHELWVGMERTSTRKHIFWGQLQKQIIKTVIHTLSPVIIHTQTKIYQSQLRKLGADAQYLPLFSNFATVKREFDSYTDAINNGKDLSLVVFGSIYPKAPIEDFAAEVAEYNKKNFTSIKLQIIGRSGPELKRWVEIWEKLELQCEVLGEQPFEKISEVMSQATFGISTTPLVLSEKSGSVAALHAHNLPVICISPSWELRKGKNPETIPGIIQYKKGSLEDVLKIKGDPIAEKSAFKVAQQLINSFSLKKAPVAIGQET